MTLPRAMTLLEVLLSLALLGGIAIACASWVGTAARGTEGTAERLRWRAAVDAALALIGDLVATGDSAPQDDRARAPGSERVRGSGGSLEIDTRLDGRAVTATVLLDDNRLVLRADRERLLLADVRSFEAKVDEEERMLTVTIRSAVGDERSRRYALP